MVKMDGVIYLQECIDESSKANMVFPTSFEWLFCPLKLLGKNPFPFRIKL